MTRLMRIVPVIAVGIATLLTLGCSSGGGSDDAGSDVTPEVQSEATVSVTTAPSTPAPTPTATALPVLPSLTPYIVQSGDNPTLIAENAGVPQAERDAWIAEMLSLNRVEAQALQIGQTLILPPLADGTLPTVRSNPGAGSGATSSADAAPGATVPDIPPNVVIAQPIVPTPAATSTPAMFAGGGIPFAPTPPFVAFATPPASNGTPVQGGTPTPDVHIWMTSSEASATYYYCDIDQGWHSIPPGSLQTFASEQQLRDALGNSRTKAPESKC